MSGEEQYTRSQLFTVRVWQPDNADDSSEWRGKLHHIPSGEVRYFRGWAALIPLMLDMLRRYPSQLVSVTGADAQKPSGASEDTNQ